MKINNDLYEYKYDDLYNITDIYLNNELINHYEYDNFNQLTSAIDYLNNKKYIYRYDSEGNITKNEICELENDITTYVDVLLYRNANWEDQLTKCHAGSITYDEIGNPLTIGSANLTWINGRQLATYTKGNLNISYNYNKDGIRKSKTVNNNTTYYFTEGNKIIFEKNSNNMLYYIRDEEGSLIGFKNNDNLYYYLKNMQEDIIGITDENFNKIVSYTYDPWGKIISIKDNNNNEITDSSHIGLINPFRYRSYYYDTETKLYYINSRYYNPEWGRFINADGIINGNKDLLGGTILNAPTAASMFNKSMNNPIGKMNNVTKNRLTKNISNSKEMKNAIKECVSKNNKKINYVCTGTEILNSTKDLQNSVGKVDYVITKVHKNYINNITELNVTVYDDYDFDEYRPWNSFSNIANNLGFFYQNHNLLASYYWEVNYSYYIEE